MKHGKHKGEMPKGHGMMSMAEMNKTMKQGMNKMPVKMPKHK